MTIQALQDIALPNGIKVRAGAVLQVSDSIGAALIQAGKARPREKPGPIEFKIDPLLDPGDPLPDPVPYVRVPTSPLPAASFEAGAYEDQDNFVRDLVTFAAPTVDDQWWWNSSSGATPAPPVSPSDSASGRTPVVTLVEIKMHCRIDLTNSYEDAYLQELEMAAHIHTENYLRYQIDDTVGENIKIAVLLLIAHWYRNREAVSMGRTVQGFTLPLGYQEILSGERDYPIY